LAEDFTFKITRCSLRDPVTKVRSQIWNYLRSIIYMHRLIKIRDCLNFVFVLFSLYYGTNSLKLCWYSCQWLVPKLLRHLRNLITEMHFPILGQEMLATFQTAYNSETNCLVIRNLPTLLICSIYVMTRWAMRCIFSIWRDGWSTKNSKITLNFRTTLLAPYAMDISQIQDWLIGHTIPMFILFFPKWNLVI